MTNRNLSEGILQIIRDLSRARTLQECLDTLEYAGKLSLEAKMQGDRDAILRLTGLQREAEIRSRIFPEWQRQIREGLNKQDTRAKLIDPGLRRSGWQEERIRRGIAGGDYLLLSWDGRSVLAVIAAKREGRPPETGLERAKKCAVKVGAKWAFSTNGHGFYGEEMSRTAAKTERKGPIAEFPCPEALEPRPELI